MRFCLHVLIIEKVWSRWNLHELSIIYKVTNKSGEVSARFSFFMKDKKQDSQLWIT